MMVIDVSKIVKGSQDDKVELMKKASVDNAVLVNGAKFGMNVLLALKKEFKAELGD